jgi:hypothetical protein
VKISKGLIGVSALAAAFAFSPAVFAQPCGGNSPATSNNGANQQGLNGWQSSSTTPAGEAANVNSNWSQGGSQNYRAGASERYSRLTREANDAISHDPRLQDENVHAWVNTKGVVVLKGEADSSGDAMRAQRVIAQYTGIKDFDNELYYPGMYGGRGANTANENAWNANNGNENAANQNNQNNGASSPSGPSMGQDQGVNSSTTDSGQ